MVLDIYYIVNDLKINNRLRILLETTLCKAVFGAKLIWASQNFMKNMLESLHFIVEETEEKRCAVSYLNQRLHCKKSGQAKI